MKLEHKGKSLTVLRIYETNDPLALRFLTEEEGMFMASGLDQYDLFKAIYEAKRDGLVEYEAYKEPPDMYKYKREAEFVQLDGEGMDAVRKAIVALANGQPVPVEYTEYQAKVDAIKAANPKPLTAKEETNVNPK